MVVEQWAERLLATGVTLPRVPGASGRLSFGATEARSDVPPHHVVFDDGRVTAAGAGLLDDADLTVLLSAADLDALWRGQLDLVVAFMQGRAKVSGPTSALIALLPVLRSAAWSQALAGSC